MTDSWRQVFGDYEHAELVHTWANIVPLSLKANIEKGRKDWTACAQFFKTETIYKTTKRLAEESEDWTPETLRARADLLSKWALERWPKEAPLKA